MGIKDRKFILNSILLGIYVSINMLTKIITSIYSFENNILLITVFIFFASLFVNKFKMDIFFVLFNFLVITLILISFFRISDATYLFNYLINYLVYGFVATYLISFQVDFRLVMKVVNVIFIAFTFILVTIYIPIIKTSTNLDFTMDLSYTSMIGVCSVLLSFKYFKEQKWMFFLNLFSLCINLWYLLELSNNRGALFTLIVLCFLLVVNNLKKMTSKVLLIMSSIIVSLVFISNLEQYLTNFYNMFLRIFNFRINWLERFLYQIKRDNILSGRDLLYTDAYNVFTGNPFIGRGVGFFEISHNGQYPHNFVLQLLAETGIVFTSFTLVVILVGLLYVIKNSEYKNRIDFMRYFFILSIPRLFISSTYWQLQFFWLYVFLCLILIKQLLYKKNKNWN